MQKARKRNRLINKRRIYDIVVEEPLPDTDLDQGTQPKDDETPGTTDDESSGDMTLRPF